MANRFKKSLVSITIDYKMILLGTQP